MKNKLYRSVDLSTGEPVNFVGVHPLKWHDHPKQPDMGFTEVETDIPDDYKEITGFDTPSERMAYDLGRRHEELSIVAFINKWNGEQNSEMGSILYDKMNEINSKTHKYSIEEPNES